MRNGVTYHGAKPLKTKMAKDVFYFAGFRIQQRAEDERPKFAGRGFAGPRPSSPRKESHGQYPEVGHCRVCSLRWLICAVFADDEILPDRQGMSPTAGFPISSLLVFGEDFGQGDIVVWRAIAPVCVDRPWFAVEPRGEGGSLEAPSREPSRLGERSLVCMSRQKPFPGSLGSWVWMYHPRGGMRFRGCFHWPETSFTVSVSGWGLRITWVVSTGTPPFHVMDLNLVCPPSVQAGSSFPTAP